MKKHNDQPIQDILKGMMKKGPLTSGYYDTQVKLIWNNKLGKLLTNQTVKIYLNKGVIYLKLNSAPLRKELFMGKEQLIKQFNEELGENLVKDMIFS